MPHSVSILNVGLRRSYGDQKTMDQEHEYLTYGLAAGAAGILPKQYVAGQIARAITTIRQGKIYLPPQALVKNSPAWRSPPGLAGEVGLTK